MPACIHSKTNPVKSASNNGMKRNPISMEILISHLKQFLKLSEIDKWHSSAWHPTEMGNFPKFACIEMENYIISIDVSIWVWVVVVVVIALKRCTRSVGIPFPLHLKRVITSYLIIILIWTSSKLVCSLANGWKMFSWFIECDGFDRNLKTPVERSVCAPPDIAVCQLAFYRVKRTKVVHLSSPMPPVTATPSFNPFPHHSILVPQIFMNMISGFLISHLINVPYT